MNTTLSSYNSSLKYLYTKPTPNKCKAVQYLFWLISITCNINSKDFAHNIDMNNEKYFYIHFKRKST